MLGLFLVSFVANAAPPTPPAAVPDKPVLLDPVLQLLSERTRAKVVLPNMALLEWQNAAGDVPPAGAFLDIWTRTPTGMCTAAQNVFVALSPKDTGDLKHSHLTIRVPPDLAKKLAALDSAEWTVRSEVDPRVYDEVACP